MSDMCAAYAISVVTNYATAMAVAVLTQFIRNDDILKTTIE